MESYNIIKWIYDKCVSGHHSTQSIITSLEIWRWISKNKVKYRKREITTVLKSAKIKIIIKIKIKSFAVSCLHRNHGVISVSDNEKGKFSKVGN